MERLNNNLNDIVGRVSTQRRYQNEQRPAPQPTEQPQLTQPAPPRRPLLEQRANLGARNPYASEQPHYTHTNAPKKTRNFSEQEEPDAYYADRSRHTSSNTSSLPTPYAQPAEYTRPPRMNQPPTVRGPYSRPPVPPPTIDESYPRSSVPPQPAPRARLHHSDDFGPIPPADAMQGWGDGVDDIVGMMNDDWEEGMMTNAQATRPPYQYAETIVKHPQAHNVPQLREVTRIEEVNGMPEISRGRSPKAVEPRPSLPTPSTTPVLPPTQRSPLSPPHIQAAGRPQQRNTQPLNARMAIDPRQAREYPERSRMQEPPKQQPRPVPAVREPVLPYVLPATPAPASQKSVCPKCKGAGYLRANVPFGHPNFGRPLPCECKEIERKDKRRQQLREMSNLDAFRDRTFRTFNARVPGVQEAYEVARDYAQEPEGWLLLVGPNGCGKTHLAAAIANQCLEDGAVVLFAVVPDLLDHLRAAFAPNSSEVFDQLFSKMREAEVLILDDLGSQQSSPWANEKLFQLLNYRYNMGMPTVITANPKGLQGVDERMRSRLMDVSLVATVNFDRARDYRPHHPRRD